MNYVEDTLIGRVTAENTALGIRLACLDAIDYAEDVFIKKIVITNLQDRARQIRILFHEDLHIFNSSESDTAYYDPDEQVIIHYKKDRYFLFSGKLDGKSGFDEFTTGVKEFRDLEGTWRDAEDGALSGNTIAQGSVDSVISFWTELPPTGEKTVYYWIAAGNDHDCVSRLERLIRERGPEHFLERTAHYWRAWIAKDPEKTNALPSRAKDIYKKSLFIIRTNIDRDGAILAALDFDTLLWAKDTYGYMWPRDSAYTSYALDKAGFSSLPRKFFEFCQGIIGRGKERSGYFFPKYMSDGSVGSNWHPWIFNGEKQLPIQEDGTGLILWSLWNHYETTRDVEFISGMFDPMIKRCADFLASYIHPELGLPKPSYDLWEERLGIFTYTCSAVYAGLEAASRFCLLFQENEKAQEYSRAARGIKKSMEEHLFDPGEKRFIKGLYPRLDGGFDRDLTVDASTYAVFYFGLYDPDDWRVKGTMQAIIERLWAGDPGGIARYEGDNYYLSNASVTGNPWVICTLWVAQWKIALATTKEELDEALGLIQMICGCANQSGILPEQMDPFTHNPLSAAPLTWSHATLVTTVLEYLGKLDHLEKSA
jgi:GH15 family glucan-1,4-alpha-glucosidase